MHPCAVTQQLRHTQTSLDMASTHQTKPSMAPAHHTHVQLTALVALPMGRLHKGRGRASLEKCGSRLQTMTPRESLRTGSGIHRLTDWSRQHRIAARLWV